MPPMPPPEPQGQPESVVLDRFDGMVNTLSLERMKPRDLVRGTNIDLDDDGQAHRRRGSTRVVVGNFHSLFQSNNGTVYGVRDGVLSIINPDYSTIALQAGIGSAYDDGGPGLAYVQVGKDVYFTCPTNAGIIDTLAASVRPWGPSQDLWLSPVVNPTATLPAIRGRLLGAPPLASYLTLFKGRIYLAAGSVLWATELFAYGLVDKTKNYIQFEGDITMLASVAEGIYVGTTEGCWYIQGTLERMQRSLVLDSPVVAGSMTYVPAELANPPQISIREDMIAAIFLTTRGVCVATDSGKAYNLTESKMFFPVARRAAATFRRQDGVNQYIAVTDTGGTPINGARAGDYVEAELIRGGAIWIDVNESALATDAVL